MQESTMQQNMARGYRRPALKPPITIQYSHNIPTNIQYLPSVTSYDDWQ